MPGFGGPGIGPSRVEQRSVQGVEVDQIQSADISQAAATVSATLREDYEVAVGATQAAAAPSLTLHRGLLAPSGPTSVAIDVTQAAASLAATLDEDFILGVNYLVADQDSSLLTDDVTSEAVFGDGADTSILTQGAASISATVREAFRSTAAITQAAASMAPVLREDVKVAPATTQAAASIAGEFTAAASAASLAVAVSQEPATVAATMVGPEATGGIGSGWSPVVIRRPKPPEPVPVPEPVAVAAFISQGPAQVGAEFTYNDDDLVLLLLAA